ncbi:hypothetical protein RJ55_01611 [Drechmeria coniospora]|nr:hypothetical protein RJ55_01611 [Drechmeria coniospora]
MMYSSPTPPTLSFHPPLLNTACPWATTRDDIEALLLCPSTGAVTTRTSLLDGFTHDEALHRHVFLDPALGGGPVQEDEPSEPEHQHEHEHEQQKQKQKLERRAVGSLNSLGYSPLTIDTYLAILHDLAASLPTTEAPSRKTIIISITDAEPAHIAICHERILAAAPELPFPLAVEINLSCPNLPSAPPPALSPSALRCFLDVLPPHPRLPLGLKLPPLTHPSQFAALVDDALLPYASRLSFVTATNTLGGCLVFEGAGDGGLLGGMGGAMLHPLALGNVATLRRMFDERPELSHLVIVGVGGVSDGDGYKRMRRAGASAVGLATGLGSRGVRVFEDIENDIGSSWGEIRCVESSSLIDPAIRN